MGTEVLIPQDCLRLRTGVYPAVFPRRRTYNNGNSCSNPRPNRKQQTARPNKPDRRGAASEPAISKASSCDDLGADSKSGLVMEAATTLRRGKSLDSKIRSNVGVREQRRVMAPRRIQAAEPRSPVVCGRCDVYAGSAFSVSPEPSSLPLPSFPMKNVAAIEDSATRDLRRLLRLD
ncbi:hypothetical protein SAY87_021961 [Trapa incisa]|uniref:Uncharacterized protein n=1 Tax=Trapa incisa TaxID=236973 RepID=A0AAN7JSN5_9MYRT|nr:hypothetical protein SAY87_021961 [Trapa incisa]